MVLLKLSNCLLTWKRATARVLGLFKFVSNTWLWNFLLYVIFLFISLIWFHWAVYSSWTCQGCSEFKWKIGDCWQDYQGKIFVLVIFGFNLVSLAFVDDNSASSCVFDWCCSSNSGLMCNGSCWKPRYHCKICRLRWWRRWIGKFVLLYKVLKSKLALASWHVIKNFKSIHHHAIFQNYSQCFKENELFLLKIYLKSV